jgi:hypothetical protein
MLTRSYCLTLSKSDESIPYPGTLYLDNPQYYLTSVLRSLMVLLTSMDVEYIGS